LSEAGEGQRLQMIGLENHTTAFLQYLDKKELALGSRIAIAEVAPFDNSLTIIINGDRQVHISHEVAKNILVTVKDS
jgi:DtxR family Mn-dependent transcriptional regulator